MNAIVGCTRKATTEILGITVPVTPVYSRPCPKCGKGNVVIRAKTARCDNASCGLMVIIEVRFESKIAEKALL